MSNQWAKYGLVLSSTGGFGTHPRLFNMANPGTVKFGDPNLGAPNEACPGGGPSWGNGSKPSTPGENCSLQGLALIIQEANNPRNSKGNPKGWHGNDKANGNPFVLDDNEYGSTIIMDFTVPRGQYMKELGVLDVDEPVNVTIEYLTSSGSIAK